MSSLLILSNAEAEESLSKSMFEAATAKMVFDIGETPGQVDVEDKIIDLYSNCFAVRPDGVPKNPFDVGLEGYFSGGAAESHYNKVNSSFSRIADSLKIQNLNPSNNVVLAHDPNNKRPVFIIYPEFHQSKLSMLGHAKEKKGHLLHISQGYDFVELVESLLSNGLKPVYLLEGYSDKYTYYESLSTNTKEERLILFQKLLAENSDIISQEVGEVFRDRLETSFVGDKRLFHEWVLYYFAYLVKKDGKKLNWTSLKVKIQSAYDYESDELEVLKKKFESIKSMSTDDLVKLRDVMCDKRSWSMADKSIRKVESESADVALVRIGASHVGGFIQRLKEKGYGYFALSPNFSSQDK